MLELNDSSPWFVPESGRLHPSNLIDKCYDPNSDNGCCYACDHTWDDKYVFFSISPAYVISAVVYLRSTYDPDIESTFLSLQNTHY